MLITTTDTVPGYRISSVKGAAFGVVVRSSSFAGGVVAGISSLFGGEVSEYTRLLEDARRDAVHRMVESATQMGANAVVGMRFDSSEVAQGAGEIVAYGTAVVLQPEG